MVATLIGEFTKSCADCGLGCFDTADCGRALLDQTAGLALVGRLATLPGRRTALGGREVTDCPGREIALIGRGGMSPFTVSPRRLITTLVTCIGLQCDCTQK